MIIKNKKNILTYVNSIYKKYSNTDRQVKIKFIDRYNRYCLAYYDWQYDHKGILIKEKIPKIVIYNKNHGDIDELKVSLIHEICHIIQYERLEYPFNNILNLQYSFHDRDFIDLFRMIAKAELNLTDKHIKGAIQWYLEMDKSIRKQL
jgi:hypothetical protein